jgi:hypothetical protein
MFGPVFVALPRRSRRERMVNKRKINTDGME